ncbi:MAG: SPFH/Band 7/PHB domain protein [Campylobacterales bacterium]|nr:SPFH/Band 7/PHB domain protein [Campylobacterales bacterium]
MNTLAFVGAIILFALVIIAKGIKIVSQAHKVVIERLGKYNRTLTGGLNFIIPIVDSVRATLTLQEQTIDIPSQSVITKDNVNISIDGIVFCKVQDAEMATYNVMDFKDSIAKLAQTTLRSEIGSMELDESLSNRETLNVRLQEALGDAASNWGIKITRVEISDISVPREIEKAMNMQMEAEREKRAIQTKAEAEKQAQIKEAEAYKQSEILKAEAIERMADAKKYEQEKIAEGQQRAMEMINEAMSKNKEASEFLLAKDRVAAFAKLAESDSNNKMILPYDVTQMIGSMSVTGEAFFQGLNKGTNSGSSNS